jgi:hypothetical protein
MITMLSFEEQLAFGQLAEARILDRLLKDGWEILPLCRFVEHYNQRDRGPRILRQGEEIVTPDLLLWRKDVDPIWLEVKTKTEPSWRRCTPGPRWEHGIDYLAFCDYEKAESVGFKVAVLLYEENMPTNQHGGTTTPNSNIVLASMLTSIIDTGDRRTKWQPSRGKAGGWFWPRQCMAQLQFGEITDWLLEATKRPTK